MSKNEFKIGKVSFEDFQKELSIDKIDISPENVRKTEATKALPEIEGSIDRIGLIQPIIVLRKGERFDCLVGQRRLLALKELGVKTVPALIVNDVDDVTQSLISFGENIHREKLSYSDTIDVLSKLFKAYAGAPPAKINQIAADLGLSRNVVVYYLTSELVPKALREMVDEKKLTRSQAYNITKAFWPDEKKMLRIANEVGRLTKTELKRTLQVAQEKPHETAEKVIEEGKKPPIVVQLIINVSRETADRLQVEAERRSKKIGETITVSELILTAIERLLREEG